MYLGLYQSVQTYNLLMQMKHLDHQRLLLIVHKL